MLFLPSKCLPWVMKTQNATFSGLLLPSPLALPIVSMITLVVNKKCFELRKFLLSLISCISS